MSIVYRAKDPMEAHWLAGLLESQDISARVEGELTFGARGEAPLDGSTLPQIVVDDEDAERAAEVIRDALSKKGSATAGAADWVCAACAESVEAQFTECWKCGAARPLDG